MKSITLLDIAMADDGHRGPYIAFLSRLFDIERLGFCRRVLFSRRPVLVTMIEDSLPIYALTALVRSLLGRPTAGFLFLPGPALERGSIRLRTKYWVLRALRHLPRVQTLTLLPFAVEPRFREIATGWIHDPQLWDLADSNYRPAPSVANELTATVRTVAAQRRICMALGRQDRRKGFDWLVALYTRHAELREACLFAFGGKLGDGLEERLAAFTAAGGFACNRFVTDDELVALYACADIVWCAYAPDYDQASGIFGRAVQLGIPVVVRRGSLNHRLCMMELIGHVAIDGDNDWEPLLRSIPREAEGIVGARTRRMRDASLSRLHVALSFKV